MGDCMGPMDGLDVLEKEKLSPSYQNSTPGPSSPLYSHYTGSGILVIIIIIIIKLLLLLLLWAP
jgi:hypothetical protein